MENQNPRNKNDVSFIKAFSKHHGKNKITLTSVVQWMSTTDEGRELARLIVDSGNSGSNSSS